MKATIHLHSAFNVGPVDRRIFGGFVEHLGRAIYGGVYEPEHPLADAHGIRSDVFDALSELGLSAMRYPGGDFASGYHWLDGVGEKCKRPTVHEKAWDAIETNQFGTDDFLSLCDRIGWDPVITVNLGNGSPQEARDWLEYCNHPGGSRFSELRKENGREKPYKVRLWCLGNELNGEWQIGHSTASAYAEKAKETALLMRALDPRIELALCGSCTPNSPTYLKWDRQVLEECYDEVDYLSIHRYVSRNSEAPEEFLSAGKSVDAQIEAVSAVCEAERARRKREKRVFLSFDEWNVWHGAGDYRVTGNGKTAPPLLEDVYTLEDALVVGQFLNSFIRHADVVKVANIAQAVNVLAPLRTTEDGVIKQPTYHAFKMFSKLGAGISLKVAMQVPVFGTDQFGEVEWLDCSAILEGDRLKVFCINRSPENAIESRIILSDAAIEVEISGSILTANAACATNTLERPNGAVTVPYAETRIVCGEAFLAIPPLALYCGEFQLDR